MSRTFNGTSDYLENPAAVVGAVPMTLACWFIPPQSSGTSRALMSIGDAAADTRVYLWLNGAFGGRLTASTVAVGGGGGAAGGIVPTQKEWVHGCGVFASSTSRSVYANGILGGTNSSSAVLGTPTVTTIGAQYVAGVRGGFMAGSIAEAAVWSAALTDDEVMLLGRGYSPQLIRPGSLVSYWPLGGQSSPAEIDLKGRFDATVNGAKPAIGSRPSLLPRTRLDSAVNMALLSASRADLTGTALTGISEVDVVAGGKTIIITLTNDTFIAL